MIISFTLEKRHIAVLHFNVSLMDLFLNIKRINAHLKKFGKVDNSELEREKTLSLRDLPRTFLFLLMCLHDLQYAIALTLHYMILSNCIHKIIRFATV